MEISEDEINTRGQIDQPQGLMAKPNVSGSKTPIFTGKASRLRDCVRG